MSQSQLEGSFSESDASYDASSGGGGNMRPYIQRNPCNLSKFADKPDVIATAQLSDNKRLQFDADPFVAEVSSRLNTQWLHCTSFPAQATTQRAAAKTSFNFESIPLLQCKLYLLHFACAYYEVFHWEDNYPIRPDEARVFLDIIGDLKAISALERFLTSQGKRFFNLL